MDRTPHAMVAVEGRILVYKLIIRSTVGKFIEDDQRVVETQRRRAGKSLPDAKSFRSFFRGEGLKVGSKRRERCIVIFRETRHLGE